LLCAQAFRSCRVWYAAQRRFRRETRVGRPSRPPARALSLLSLFPAKGGKAGSETAGATRRAAPDDSLPTSLWIWFNPSRRPRRRQVFFPGLAVRCVAFFFFFFFSIKEKKIKKKKQGLPRGASASVWVARVGVRRLHSRVGTPAGLPTSWFSVTITHQERASIHLFPGLIFSW